MADIITPRLRLRPFTEADYDDLYEFLSQLRDDEFEGYPGITYENGREHIEYRLDSEEFFAVELLSSGKVIGNIYCGRREYNAREVGYIINKNHQRQGCALEALRAVINRAFKEGAHRVYAECDPRNIASWKLLEKVGAIDAHQSNPDRVSYTRYMELHTADRRGNTPDEMADNLSRNLAAYALRKLNTKFDLKVLHKTAAMLKDLYCLDVLKNDPASLKKMLKDPMEAAKAGRRMRDSFYGVAEEQRDEYIRKMQKLSANMVDPSGHSKEYRRFCDCVIRASELGTTTAGMSEEKRAEAFRQANIDLMDAAFQYSKGKEKLRRSREGNACIANALDAVSIVTQHTELAHIRAQRWIDGINAVRRPEQQIDGQNLQSNYGANRASENPFKPRVAVQPQGGIGLGNQ